MEGFTDDEIRQIESSDDLQDMITVLDSILDGEAFHIRTSDTDKTLDTKKKPVLPKGIISSDANVNLKNNNKNIYAYVLSVLIGLIADLNPNMTDNEEDYVFRLAILTNIIVSGCICENDNFVYSDIIFDAKYVKEKGKELKSRYKDLIVKVNKSLNAASNFLAFSCMNMVRFNHHFPIEKLNLIEKSLMGLTEEHRNRIIEENKLETFYDHFVTAARVLNDKKYYEKYILKKENENNKYYYYKVLGTYDVVYEEEIIKIRNVNTPNGFLICDIAKEIITDLKNKELLFLIPYNKLLVELMKIRNHIRKNPFGYHPSKFFYKCKADDYDDIVSRFQNIMKNIGSFIFVYSEEMYTSVRDAKCRNKYQKQIKKEDENLVKLLNRISSYDVQVDANKEKILKEKINTYNVEINEETDIKKLNKEAEALYAGVAF